MSSESWTVGRLPDAGLTPAERAAWSDLGRSSVFRRPEWLLPWWSAYRHSGMKPVLLVANAEPPCFSDDATKRSTVESDRNALAFGPAWRGLAPLIVESTATEGRRLRLMGSGEVCTDHLGLLCGPNSCDQFAQAVAKWLDEAARGLHGRDVRWDTLALECIPEGEPTLPPLLDHLAAAGHTVTMEPGLNVWRLDLPSSWDDYLASLSKGHRKQLRRLDRDYLESGRCRLVDATPERSTDDAMPNVDGRSSFDEAFSILTDLHQRRRRSIGQPGCFADSRFETFLRDAGRAFLAAGQLDLTWMALDGSPAAAEIHFRQDGVVSAYQAGVDPERLDDEPGRVFSIAILKRAIARGDRVMDFLRGDEPYKAHWRAEPMPTVNVRVAANRFDAQLRHGLWQAGRSVKSWLKSSWSRNATPTVVATEHPSKPEVGPRVATPVGEPR